MVFQRVRIFIVSLILLLSTPASAFWGSSRWQDAGALPQPRWMGGAALGGDGKIYFMGGYVFAPRAGIRPDDEPDVGYGIGKFAMDIFDPKTGRSKPGPPVEYFEYIGRLYIPHTRVGKYTPKGYEILEERIEVQDQPSQMKLKHEAIVAASDARGRVHWLGMPYQAVYNPELGAWKPDRMPFYDSKTHVLDPPLMPYAVFSGSAATGPDGKIYLTGGVGLPSEEITRGGMRRELLEVLQVYDPLREIWVLKSSMSQARRLHASAFGPDGKLYVFGGYHGTGSYRHDPNDPDDAKKAEIVRQYARRALDSVECYDPVTDTWTQRAPMPLPRQNMGAALGADGRIYVVGGYESYTGSIPQKDVQIYDPKSDTWTKGPSLKVSRGNHAVVATPDGKIYAIGGTNTETVATPMTFLTGTLSKRGGPLASIEVLDTRRRSER